MSVAPANAVTVASPQGAGKAVPAPVVADTPPLRSPSPQLTSALETPQPSVVVQLSAAAIATKSLSPSPNSSDIQSAVQGAATQSPSPVPDAGTAGTVTADALSGPAEPSPSRQSDSPDPSQAQPPDQPVVRRETSDDAPAQRNGKAALEQAQAEAEREQVQALKARDLEVRRHEQAHAAAGGVYAGAPTYEFTTGPDGARYATGGEVSIDTSPVPGDPQATLEKAQTVRRAALAPAEPSEQDRRVAAEASQMAAQARVELLQLQRSEEEDASSEDEARVAGTPEEAQPGQRTGEVTTNDQAEQKQGETDTADENENSVQPALLYSDDDEGDAAEDDEQEPGPSARERFEQVYGDVSSLTQQVGDLAQWEAAQPVLENLLDDIV